MLARIREFLLHSCVELWSLLENTCTLSDKFWKKIGKMLLGMLLGAAVGYGGAGAAAAMQQEQD